MRPLGAADESKVNTAVKEGEGLEAAGGPVSQTP